MGLSSASEVDDFYEESGYSAAGDEALKHVSLVMNGSHRRDREKPRNCPDRTPSVSN